MRILQSESLSADTRSPTGYLRVAANRWALGICFLFLVVFAILSYSAVLTKNATIDEPTHALAGWCAIRHGDFAVETVNPSLWKCWAGLGNLFSEPSAGHAGVVFAPTGDVSWASRVLFGTPGFNGAGFVNRARRMMLVIGVLLGGLIGWWSWKLAGQGGPVAAVVATFLFCFDPNFIAHSALVKSDVAFALVLLGFSYAVWQFGQKATIGRIVGIGVLCGVAINVKFSGVIVGPMLAGMLVCRVLVGERWNFLGRELGSVSGRLIAGVGSGVVAASCCVGVTWICYGAGLAGDQPVDMAAIYQKARVVETTVELNRTPTQGELDRHVPGGVCRFVAWADGHRILPRAMLAGFLYQHSCVALWPAFLNGELYGDGRWYYFPLAMIYKTPIAELFGMGLGVVMLGWWGIRLRAKLGFDSLWAGICLLVAFAIFAIAAMGTHLNIGYRNALPLLPIIYIGVGCAAAVGWRRMRRVTVLFIGLIAVGMGTETLLAWPDYIAFFNVGVGGERGGIAHLADSNLDWGQDINLLVEWQRAHSDVPIYGALYDGVEPSDLGLRYRMLEVDGMVDPTLLEWVVAVSATRLQGLYDKPGERAYFRRLLLERKPDAVLGGTIYLYYFRGEQSR